MKINNKQGQVTIFVVLGLIVFILAFIAFFLIFNQDTDPEKEYITEYDARLQPLVYDVNQCTKELGREALVKIGLQGGYLNTSTFLYNLDPSYLNNALEFFPESKQIIPYWYYVRNNPGSTDIQFEIAKPSLNNGESSIKFQVEEYIENNLLNCLNNFENYQDLYAITYLEPKADVLFRESDVFITLDWEIEITFVEENFKTNLNRFTSTLDVEFKQLYELAEKILYETQLQSEPPFLEEYTIKILELLSLGGKEAEIPPIMLHSEREFHVPTMWRLENVKDVLQTQLADNSGFLQVMGARDSFIPLTTNPIESMIYSSFVYTLDEFETNNKLATTRVNFDYMPIWPMYVKINPGYGPIITTSSDLSVNILGLFNFAITNYEFFYDMAYPVLITLEDPNAFGGEGYTFRYVIEVNINQNQPVLTEFIEIEIDEVEHDAFDGYGYVDQRTIPVTISVRDGYTGAIPENFVLAYSCLDVIIPVGNIDGDDSIIKTMMPPCIGGEFISLTSDFYASKLLDLEIDNNYEFILDVYPEKEITIRPRKKEYISNGYDYSELQDSEKRNWSLVATEDGLLIGEGEKITLMLLRKNNPSYTKIMELKYPETEVKTQLFPGEYELILLNDLSGTPDDNPLLEVEERTYSIGGAGLLASIFMDKEEVTFNKTEINDTLLLGGLMINEPNYINIMVDDLKNNNFMNIFYPAFDRTQIKYHQDLEILGRVMEVPEEEREHFGYAFVR